MLLSETERRLIDGWQRDFPLASTPFAIIADALDETETSIIKAVSSLFRKNIISRLGVTVRPNTVGASTLAAMRVPEQRLDAIAQIVSNETAVNHNYEREHDINLWFVITGPDRKAVETVISRIERSTGLNVLDLPLEKSYFIDLGFPISNSLNFKKLNGHAKPWSGQVSNTDKCLLNALEQGLPLTSRPYLKLTDSLDLDEKEVLTRLRGMIERGIISRFGFIVRHKELGYTANAMVVWDVEDHKVDAIGERFAEQPFVTLCYRRPRRRPDWPFNLFCMIHGRNRGIVENQAKSLTRLANLEHRRNSILFSTRRFKQRGARLSAA